MVSVQQKKNEYGRRRSNERIMRQTFEREILVQGWNMVMKLDAQVAEFFPGPTSNGGYGGMRPTKTCEKSVYRTSLYGFSPTK